ncbi:MAG: dephospho-CoA kinase [Thiotrichaceae bacterium]
MLKVGLTGGIGCGKSTAIRFFQQRGVPVIDADRIAKKMVESGQPALDEIADSFGNHFIQADGQLNRALLKEKVFSDKAMLNQLEAILHPRIRHAINLQMDALLAKNENLKEHGDLIAYDYLIVDVPLLVEKDYQDLFDEIIVVDCAEQQQLQRVLKRDDLIEQVIQAIMDKQATRKERLEIATETLDNTGSINALEQLVDALHVKFLDKSILGGKHSR